MTTPKETELGPKKSRRFLWITIGVIAVVLVAAAGGGVWYLNRPVPEEVSLDAALESVSSTTTATPTPAPDTSTPEADTSTTAPVTSTEAPAPPAGVDGSWEVDTTVGEFSFLGATSSFAGFRIAEELANFGNNTAVGRTPAVAGTVVFSGAQMDSAEIVADFTQIVTDQSRRDRRVKEALETGSFPTAKFATTEPIDLGTVPVEGDPIEVTAVGELTIHGVTNEVEIPLEAQLSGDLIVVVGSVNILLSDYGVTAPTAPLVISVSDTATVEMQLFLRRVDA